MAEGFQDEDISENLDDSSSEADSLSSFFERFTFRGLDADTAIKLKKRCYLIARYMALLDTAKLVEFVLLCMPPAELPPQLHAGQER